MKDLIIKTRNTLSDIKIVTATLVVIIKATFIGVLMTEVCTLSIIGTEKINSWINLNNYEYSAFFVSAVCIVILILYSFTREIFQECEKIAKSGRLDVMIAIYFGIWVAIIWSNLLSDWYVNAIQLLTLSQLLTITFSPFILCTLVALKSILPKEEHFESLFVADSELDKRENDLLNFTEKANNFAERVYNGGSSKSFVFGVDAPWGIGKSTFINFCSEYWKEKYDDKIIVYQFSPLKHSGTNNLLEVFIDGLIHSIQKKLFVPEVKRLISNYSRLLKEVGRFSLFGFITPTLTADYTSEEACEDLSAILKRLDKKVIIVVDDLDRIRFSEIKDILFVIRKSFDFPNVSFVICYDTDNINMLESESNDLDKISEFLEKFVNIKISLYLDRNDLANYVSENLAKTLATNLVDPILVSQAIGGLLDIYKSSSYHDYLPFIGDVRKLKRLINTVMLFELQTTDFKNSDFDKRDLINLLLIYINYPNIFRKIYDTETDGGRGFFSLVLPYEDGYPPTPPGAPTRSSFNDYRYENSTYYTKYLDELKKDNRNRECFLLDEIFNVTKRLIDNRIDSVSEDTRTSFACFNGGWTNGRNLETYLELIVKLSKPLDIGQHRFYTKWRDEITNGYTTIDSAFMDEKFSYKYGEYAREKMWRILVNSARSLKKDKAQSIIKYLLDNISDYSLIEIKEETEFKLGLRHSLDYFLTRILNDAGWVDRSGGHSGNMPENIKEIAEWIFGDGRHVGEGVIDKLSQPSRGILGLHDLMLFRLSCSADRGGDIFDLSRSLAYHANENAPTQGDTKNIAKEEMREISQKVFNIFDKQYIQTGKNIFKEIDCLKLEDLVGKSDVYLKKNINDGKIQESEIEKKVIELKTRIGSFIIYQLGNNEISMGAGCGYYDPTGTEDGGTIKTLINDYLFDLCFDPSDPINAEYFIDYLFRNFTNTIASSREDDLDYIPTISEFTKVLDPVKLSKYWGEYKEQIKAMHFDQKEKTIFMGKEGASYRQYVPMIYKVLDDHLIESERSITPTAQENIDKYHSD